MSTQYGYFLHYISYYPYLFTSNNLDIADWLIEHRLHPRAGTRPEQPALTPQEVRSRRTLLKVTTYFSPQYHNEIKALIEDLDLVTY